jgi:hypothetical protein
MGSALNLAIGAPYPIVGTAITSISASTLSTLNSKIAAVLAFPCSGTSDTITHVGYRQGTSTGTPGSNSYKIGIQGVDASGLPDGTYLGGGSPASLTFTPAGANDNTWVWAALTNSISINRDVRIALVLERITATDAGNCIAAGFAHGRHTLRVGIPYSLTHNGTSWTKRTGDGTANTHAMGFKSAAAVYGYPAKNQYIATDTYGSTVEVGMYFTLPANLGATYKVKGVRFAGLEPPSGTGVHYATLYSAPVTGTIAIQNQSLASDNDAFSSNESSDRVMEFYFSGALATLNTATEYGVGLAVTAGSSMHLACLEAQAAADFDAWPGGQQFGFMSRTLNTDFPPSSNDTNNFTKTATKRPLMELILDDLTAPSGGGTTVYTGGVTF